MQSALLEGQACLFRGKTADLLQKLRNIVKDIDDELVKEQIQAFLKASTDAFTFVVLGEVKAGKSSFINALLGVDICPVAPFPCTNKIHELRCGEQSAKLSVSDTYEREFVANDLLRDIAIVDTPGINSIVAGDELLTQKFIPSSDLLLVVLPTNNPHSQSIWDFLRNIQGDWNKKILFVLQQKDLVSAEELDRAMESVRGYARSIGIHNPSLFAVSAQVEQSGLESESGFTQIRDQVQQLVTGVDAVMEKQTSTLQITGRLLKILRDSFDNRYKQYLVDKQIVERINRSLDQFRENHQQNIDSLLSGLMGEVDNEVEKYRQEIIQRLDPHTICERFPRRTDFESWLVTVNENYAKVLNSSIDRKTQRAICNYVADMDSVLSECCALIRDREVLLKAEDHLYGSLARSKASITREVQTTTLEIAGLNKNLMQASETLFAEVWQARQDYDQKLMKRVEGKRNRYQAIVGGSALAGAAVASGGTAWAIFAAAAATTAAQTAAGAAAVAGAAAISLTPIGQAALIGFAVVGLIGLITQQRMMKVAQEMGEALYGKEMDEAVAKCIDKFSANVEQARLDIRLQLEDKITTMFQHELQFMERSFLEFRMATYIDDTRLPELKGQLEQVELLAQTLSGELQQLRLETPGKHELRV